MGTVSHLGGFSAIIVTLVVIKARQGTLLDSRPSSPEAVHRVAQGAQALPKPEPGLTGAHRMMWHAFPGHLVARVQGSWLTQHHKQQTRNQQKKNAGQSNENRHRVSSLGESLRSGRSPQEAWEAGEAGAPCAHGGCKGKIENQSRKTRQRQVRLT